MAPRTATRPTRENDFSNVGKVGRRTGVTLPHGRLDANGMEEISGIFSSPRKPSPLRKSTSVVASVEEINSITPVLAKSARKSLPPPRSASPRKSGIGGTARRGRIIDALDRNKEQEVPASELNDIENLPTFSPILLSSGPRKFSPEKTPLKDVTGSRPQTVRIAKKNATPVIEHIQESREVVEVPSEHEEEISVPDAQQILVLEEDDNMLPATGDDDDQVSVAASLEDDLDEPPLPPPFDDEDADETFEPGASSKPKLMQRPTANSTRKRKSDALEQELDVEVISSPAAKRAKRISDQTSNSKQSGKSTAADMSKAIAPKPRGRPPLKNKDTNTKLSARQEDELNNVIEKARARPGQKKSLYVLRRETPMEDGATHTRSGRISVKPLAYWRNERCVYGGSPGGASLQDGARFPLNSIKEIIRTEEVKSKSRKNPSKPVKGQGKGALQGQREISEEEEENSDDDLEEYHVDPDAEPWETEKGYLRGPVGVWDQQTQGIVDEEENIDIAYAAESIETRELKDSTFRYAKLLSLEFFGCGIVDLPPGGVKKAKNSRRMHMSFFVATGRATVIVGPLGGSENRFSIGKGGWWQVPRGNQYAIENRHHKPTRIFFSQACEPLVEDDED